MNQVSEMLAREISDATGRLEAAIAEVRQLACVPVEVKCGDVTLFIQPESHDRRIVVKYGDWGCTSVNYTSEGLVLDVYAGESSDQDLVHTAAIPKEDLMNDIDPELKTALASTKTITLIVEAHALSDFCEGPTGAAIKVDPTFIKRLVDMQRRPSGNISLITVYDGPESWYPKGVEDELRLNHAQLVFASDSFWFTDHPNHADYDVQSRELGTATLLKIFNEARDGQTVVEGSDEFKAYMADHFDEPVGEVTTHG